MLAPTAFSEKNILLLLYYVSPDALLSLSSNQYSSCRLVDCAEYIHSTYSHLNKRPLLAQGSFYTQPYYAPLGLRRALLRYG